MIRNNLHQDQVWITKDGHELRLADMEPRHRRNVLAMLRRNAARLKYEAMFRMAVGPRPRGDAACDAFDDAFAIQLEQLDGEWLERRPLVVELARLVAEDEAVHRHALGPFGESLAELASLLRDSDGLDYWLVQP